MLDANDLQAAREAAAAHVGRHPRSAAGHFYLGVASQRAGDRPAALRSLGQAFQSAPDKVLYAQHFGQALSGLAFSHYDEPLAELLRHLIEMGVVSPANYRRAVIGLLKRHPRIAAALSSDGEADLDAFADVPLLLAFLVVEPIGDPDLEPAFERLRRSVLDRVAAGRFEPRHLPFAAALACQCFLVEYVMPTLAEEAETLATLIANLTSIGPDHPDVPALAAAVGCYRGLATVVDETLTHALAGRPEVATLVRLQIQEPIDERSLARGLDSLTDVNDTVSRAVRDQYEANPYPRWTCGTPFVAHETVERSVQDHVGYPLEAIDWPTAPRILVAGCGTGQQIVQTATRFADASIVAVDLSRASLAYAKRKAHELGLANVGFHHADLLALQPADGVFDVVQSTGVLHHLADPMAGWQNLVRCTRPGGLLQIGLYSRTARRDIARVRDLLAARGITGTGEGIVEARRTVVALARAGDVECGRLAVSRDFASASGCRDLILHEQEHLFTLPEIEAALDALGLRFLGMELPNTDVLRWVEGRWGDLEPCRSLAFWHAVEQRNPDLFARMYVFWCQRTD
ncbi:MAG: class I SAM-dependent methyltransferase [Pseudomonadota bacterium]